MATITNVPQSFEQSKSAVVPFPAPQEISQLELAALLSLRGRLHQLEQQVEAAEQSIKSRQQHEGGGYCPRHRTAPVQHKCFSTETTSENCHLR